MDDQIKTAFQFAKETVTQLLTLSTAIITLTVTFTKDFIGTVDASTKQIAVIAWGFYVLSILFGLITLFALTGTLGRSDPSSKVSIYGRNVTFPALIQIITFFFGVVGTVIFGIKAVNLI